MTIEHLKKYRYICAEIDEIKQKLSDSYAGDTVQSGSKHPYSVHNVRIEGFKSDKSTISLLTKLSNLEHSRKEIEEYINSIDDYSTKKMFEMKFYKDKTYLQIAMGLSKGRKTEDWVRKRIDRYLEKN